MLINYFPVPYKELLVVYKEIIPIRISCKQHVFNLHYKLITADVWLLYYCLSGKIKKTFRNLSKILIYIDYNILGVIVFVLFI